MSQEESDIDGAPENHVEEEAKQEDEQLEPSDVIDDNVQVEDEELKPSDVIDDNGKVGDEQLKPSDVINENVMVEDEQLKPSDVINENVMVEDEQLKPRDVIDDNVKVDDEQLKPSDVIDDNVKVKDEQLKASDVINENVMVDDEQLTPSNVIDDNVKVKNGLGNGNVECNYSPEELVQMVVELNFQNEYMKSQFEGLKNQGLESDTSDVRSKSVGDDSVKSLQEKVESLNRELIEERQTRAAAEEALKHLRAEYSEADGKAEEFSAKLAEAQQKMDQEIKEREEKYSELDTKFTRLHKRAKQRIQEVQKEKDDLEAQFREANEKSERSSAQLVALQQELERTRQHANEAVKAIDVERQQLRSTNNKLRDNIEELRRSLVPKENALDSLQQLLQEKEQMLEDLNLMLQAADEKHHVSIAELSLKHQKQVEDMEAQIADVLDDRTKATDTISSLRALVSEKETKIAEMDAASSGETARLIASMKALKGELNQLKTRHEKEQENFEVALQSMKTKLEIAESNRISAEVEAAKLRSQLESELSAHTLLLNSKEAELLATKERVDYIESEFSSYKVRAHALLQKKDAELAGARDNEQLKALEEALKEAEKEIHIISTEKDQVLQDLKDSLANFDNDIVTRDAALSNAKQQIDDLQRKLDSILSRHQSEKQAWDTNLQNVEETWRLRLETLKKESEVHSGQNFEKEVEDLKLHCKKLEEEQNEFRDLADKMMEEKEREISRLLDENKKIQHLLASRPQVENRENHTANQKLEASISSTSVAEQQILILARQQAQREEELAQTQRHILALQEELEELEHENRLHRQQESVLKEELRNMERQQKREGVDMTYLKNVVLMLLQTGEVERLLPVVAMLLQFSPDETQKCQQAYHSPAEVPPPSPASESPGSGLSLFSRFTFS